MCKREILLVHKEDLEEEKAEVQHGSIAHRLGSLAEQYNEPLELLADLYVQCSGEFDRVENYCKKQPVVMWTGLEDN